MADSTPPLHQLIYGLIYPGVLGTGMVLTAYRATGDGTVSAALLDPSIQVAVAAACIFAASFVAAFQPIKKDKPIEYGILAFGIDLVEVVLMFWAFYYLRLFKAPDIIAPNLPFAYSLLAADVLMQFGWRASVGLPAENDRALRILATASLVFGAIFGHACAYVNVCVTVFVLVLLAIYIWKDPRYHQEDDSRGNGDRGSAPAGSTSSAAR